MSFTCRASSSVNVDYVSSCICLSPQYSWTILHAHHITSRASQGRERGSLYCTALYTILGLQGCHRYRRYIHKAFFSIVTSITTTKLDAQLNSSPLSP